MPCYEPKSSTRILCPRHYETNLNTPRWPSKSIAMINLCTLLSYLRWPDKKKTLGASVKNVPHATSSRALWIGPMSALSRHVLIREK